jgi:DNA polymerase-3 subunit epsilon
MKVLGLDLETSGLDPKKDRILEVGAVLWDWENRIPLQMLSAFVDPSMDGACPGSFEVTPEITEITGITTGMIEEFGLAEKDVLFEVGPLSIAADYFMGHNCNLFDSRFIDEACFRHGGQSFGKQWLDTSCDIKFPPRIKTRNLRHLAAEHGFLNPFSHRAVFDVLTMFQVASQYPLETIVARANEPTVYLQALVSYDEKERAKERGYRWNPGMRVWWKDFKQSDAEAEIKECGFATGFLADRPVEA